MASEFIRGIAQVLGGAGAVVFLFVPGYVVLTALDRERYNARRTDLHTTVSFAVYGVLVHLVVGSWTIFLWGRVIKHWDAHSGLNFDLYAELAGWTVLVLFIAPILLGNGLRWVLGHRWGLPTALGFSVANRTSNALLWSMSRSQGQWVRIYLKSGEVYVGRFDEDSLLGTESHPGDLHLNKVWVITADGAAANQAVSIWIPGSELKLLEFFSED